MITLSRIDHDDLDSGFTINKIDEGDGMVHEIQINRDEVDNKSMLKEVEIKEKTDGKKSKETIGRNKVVRRRPKKSKKRV